jgi:archaellum component FlaF (FlaF/FlaG flagellin family)
VKNRFSKVLVCALVTLFLASFVCVAVPARAAATAAITLINPLDGSSSFSFTSAQKSLGDNFDINITIGNVANMSGWQVGINWDPTLLDFFDFVLPTDNVLAYGSPIPAFAAIAGNVVGGANLGFGAKHNFTGSGTLAVLTLKIIKVTGTLSGTFDFEGIGSDTFLLTGLGTIDFTSTGAQYSYTGPAGPTHDVAVTNVVPSSTSVVNGSSLNIDVTVTNTGSFTETFNVTVFANSVQVAPNQTATSLLSGNSTTKTFVWNTTGFALGDYELTAIADFPGDPTPGDNTFDYGKIHIISAGQGHDVGVVNIVPKNPASVGQGYSLNVSVTVNNTGIMGFSETFDVAIYANGSQVAPPQTVNSLSPGKNATLTFRWNTTTTKSDIGNYTLSAFADLPGDPTPADNNLTYNGMIYVMLPGDVLNLNIVNMIAIRAMLSSFNAFVGGSRYKPFMDINADGRIDLWDIVIAIMNFNRHL